MVIGIIIGVPLGAMTAVNRNGKLDGFGRIFALIGLHLYLVVRLGETSPPWAKHPAGSGPVPPSSGGASHGGQTRA